METMIPLGLVLGWIFAVLGTLVLACCYAEVMIEAKMIDNEAKKFQWIFAIALITLIAGVILITKYWMGGV